MVAAVTAKPQDRTASSYRYSDSNPKKILNTWWLNRAADVSFPPRLIAVCLLTKAVNEVPHGGGQRLEKDSHEYRLLARWIAQGMPYGSDKDRVLNSITINPTQRLKKKNSSQQLTVTATYSDGSTEDITRTAQYESNNTDMANVSTSGLVSSGSGAGDVAVMALSRPRGRLSR